MSYIKFDKKQLINLEYSLSKELIRTNRAGGYASKTIIGCHTRKYHGLLVVPQPAIDDDNHVLLSNFDETIIQHEAEFNLGIHKYPGGIYNPKGHKYIRDFSMEPIPNTIYHVGGVVLKREILFAQASDRIMIRYTLVDAHSPTLIRFRPFLAFRNVHMLSKANVTANKKYDKVRNGIRMKLYPGYSYLYMQFSKPMEYTHFPDWFYNIEYQKEYDRGYEHLEDLLVPGFFEAEIKKGESIVFCAGTAEIDPAAIKRTFSHEVHTRVPRNSFENCLINAAHQFIVHRGSKTEIIAGFPWFGRWGRDTFVSLPGLTLALGDEKTFKAVVDTSLKEMKGPLFPNMGVRSQACYNSVDAPLWFFWALQQYSIFTGNDWMIWTHYGRKMKMILEGFRQGTEFNIKMQDNGLLYAGNKGVALTWMDVVVDGKPLTPRSGLAVEVNALWYNAIMFALELADKFEDKKLVKTWEPVANNFPSVFVETFWDEEKGYLADFVDGECRDFSVRPNMVIATAMRYPAIDEGKRNRVLDVAAKELLTSRGLRTLSPKNHNYKGIYFGDQKKRDQAYHQGTIFPWLMGFFAESYLRLHGKAGVPYVKNLYQGFEEVMPEHGIGTVSEVYDGDPPHLPGGALSQAWSVSELLRMRWLMEKYDKTE